jgi:hypothetical protein
MGELYVPTPDQFEIERPMQPKRAVGDYVESEGILVPRRFETFEEAQFEAQNGASVIARSEHPDEYSGPSGLGYSGVFVENEDGVMLPKQHIGRDDLLKRYLSYIYVSGAVEPTEYLAQASESYWQAVPGVNVTCVADDAIEGRYHIFGHRYRKYDGSLPSMAVGAIVEENGNVVRIAEDADDGENTSGLVSRFSDVINMYNQVRQLDSFSEVHCPIMEMQIADVDDRIYFLQYHRVRDASYTTERLDPADFDERDGWLRADHVRGAYVGKKALNLALFYGGKPRAWLVRLPEDGSATTWDAYQRLDECIGRQRIAHLIGKDFERVYEHIASNHGPRSCMFKPQVSMLTNPSEKGEHISEELHAEAFDLGFRQKREVRVETDVASDGRVGYFRYSDELVVADQADW